MDEIDVGWLRIAYQRAGSGPPLMLLHGGPLDSREFRRQLEGLADEFTVVAWDMPGCSARRPAYEGISEVTVDELVEYVTATVQRRLSARAVSL